MRPVGQEGFTLIEVLVSFVILSGAIILTFQIFSDGLLGVEVSRAKAQEVISAEQLIGQLSLRADLQAGTMIETIGDSKLRAAVLIARRRGVCRQRNARRHCLTGPRSDASAT